MARTVSDAQLRLWIEEAKREARREQRAAAKRAAPVPGAPVVGYGAITIAEFCRAYHISRGTFSNWQIAGVGPALTQPLPGGRVLITAEAEAAWKAKHTAPPQWPASRQPQPTPPPSARREYPLQPPSSPRRGRPRRVPSAKLEEILD